MTRMQTKVRNSKTTALNDFSIVTLVMRTLCIHRIPTRE
jgi:hypothetical protein